MHRPDAEARGLPPFQKKNEDNFIVVIGGGQTSLANRQGFIRRLSIQHIDPELAHLLAEEDLSHVRSLTVTSSACIQHLPSLAKFEALRVLDFQSCEGLEEYDMKSIGKLFQLKYLNFRGTWISKLPAEIMMLRDLETLDFGATRVEELPTGFAQLTKLQHLIAESETNIGIPNNIGNMRNLREVSGFSITQSPADAVENLGNLPGLEEIHVDLDGGESEEFRRHEEMLLFSLCRLGSCKLRSLRIRRYDGSLEFLGSWSPLPYSLQVFYMSSNYYLTEVPQWIAPALTNLSYIDINLAELTEEGLVTLGELPALLRLDLWFKTRPKDKVTVQGFPSLKEFLIHSTTASSYVTFVKGSMPKLKKLDLLINVSVAKTYGFYLGIEHLTCLKQATARLDNTGATPSERKAAEAVIRAEAGAHPNHPAVTTIYMEYQCYEEDSEDTGGGEKKSKEDGNTDDN